MFSRNYSFRFPIEIATFITSMNLITVLKDCYNLNKLSIQKNLTKISCWFASSLPISIILRLDSSYPNVIQSYESLKYSGQVNGGRQSPATAEQSKSDNTIFILLLI